MAGVTGGDRGPHPFSLNATRILLASHGTPGSRAAEEAALALCAGPEAEIFHLTVVPDLWQGMMGDDWLNNVSTRDRYCKHVESQLQQEIELHRQDLAPRVAARGARYRARVMVGKPSACLLEYASEVRPDVVVIGAPRPPGTGGLRSRMHVDSLVSRLSATLLVVPHPGRADVGN